MLKYLQPCIVLLLLSVTMPTQAAPMAGDCAVFPGNDIWNTKIDQLPVDLNSDKWIAAIGAEDGLHPDFGAGLYEGAPIGIPFSVVPMAQTKVAINFAEFDDESPATEESDAGPYPIPIDAMIEGGQESRDDRHVLVVQQGSCTLYELYKAVPQPDGSWNATGASRFDLETGALRPETWTSADAAGLPIFPGLVRQEEVAAGAIEHAIRFTVPDTGPSFVWPARHQASRSGSEEFPPMGQRFRLKASVDISGLSPENQIILMAMKSYGLILADNGSAWFISGAPNDNWNNDDLHDLGQIKGSDFEAVDVSGLMVDPDLGTAKGPNRIGSALGSIDIPAIPAWPRASIWSPPPWGEGGGPAHLSNNKILNVGSALLGAGKLLDALKQRLTVCSPPGAAAEPAAGRKFTLISRQTGISPYRRERQPLPIEIAFDEFAVVAIAWNAIFQTARDFGAINLRNGDGYRRSR